MAMLNQPPNTFGFDASVPLSRVVGGLSAIGVTGVGRYVALGEVNAWKVLTPTEAVELAIAGIAVFPIYETTASAADHRSADGAYANGYLPSVGLFPDTGVCLYDTQDGDATAANMPAIIPAVKSFFAQTPGYRRGIYAGGYCATQLKEQNLIDLVWITQSMEFTGTQQVLSGDGWDMVQRLPADMTINNAFINVDPDSKRLPNADIGARVPWNGAVPENAVLSVVATQMLLNKATNAGLATDNESGPNTDAALAAFLVKGGFETLTWGGAIEALLEQAGVSIYKPSVA
jgi:hypothetical protein